MAVKSVVHAIAILRRLATGRVEGVSKLARALDLSPSSCFNLLKTLSAEGLVDFDPVRKTYALAAAPALLFQPFRGTVAWAEWLKEQLRRLASDFALCCGLWEVRGDRVVLIEVAESPQSTRIHLSVGQRLPALIGALGRCIAGRQGLSRDQLTRMLAGLRWQVPPRIDDYLQDVREAAARGWAVDADHYLKGVTTIAAPIDDRLGRVGHCLTSVMFSGQHDNAALEEIGRQTAALSREASQRLKDIRDEHDNRGN